MSENQCGEDVYSRLTKVEIQNETIKSDIAEVKITLKEVATHLQTLAVLEVKHQNTTDSLKRAFNQVAKLEERCDDMEKKLPNLILASHWVFKAMLGIMGLLGVASLGHTIKIWFGN